jgi:hypothetical protein
MKSKIAFNELTTKIQFLLTNSVRKIGLFFKSWTYLFLTLLKRFIEGFKHIDFLIYFLVVILIVGGLGISPILYKIYLQGADTPENLNELSRALSTYFITIIATSSADLILNKLPDPKEARSLRMPALTCLIIGGISIFMIQYNLIPQYSLNIAIYATFGALFLWWITNSTDGKYKLDDQNEQFTAPMGGPIAIPDNDQNLPNVIM